MLQERHPTGEQHRVHKDTSREDRVAPERAVDSPFIRRILKCIPVQASILLSMTHALYMPNSTPAL